MTEIITTAAELDALPVGSIVIDAFAAACVKARESKPSMPSDWVRVTPAVRGGEHHHRPFVPAVAIRIGLDDPHQPVTTQPTVKPSREWLSEALMQIYDHGTLPNALREAAALLNLWSGRTEAEVKAEALREAADEAEALNRAAEKGCGCNADWLMPDLSIDKVRARADRIEEQP